MIGTYIDQKYRLSDDYLVFVKDQLGWLEEISIRRMFGGAGIYCDGDFFAIVVDDSNASEEILRRHLS